MKYVTIGIFAAFVVGIVVTIFNSWLAMLAGAVVSGAFLVWWVWPVKSRADVKPLRASASISEPTIVVGKPRWWRRKRWP